MSDQDFFFDEDEKPAEKSASKPVSKPSGKPSSPKGGAAPAAAGERTVTMTVAALIGVVALLFGVIIGLFAAPDSGKVASPNSTATQGTAAPALTDEQIQQGLPEGHPTIPQDMTATSTGEATATK